MITNPYKPADFAPSTSASVTRLTACVAAMIATMIVFMYFSYAAAVYGYMLIFPQPGWSAFDALMNAMIWSGFAVIAGGGFMQALRSMRTAINVFD